MTSRWLIGFVLVSTDRRAVWVGGGTLPLSNRLPRWPALFDDRRSAQRAATALKEAMGLALRPEPAWAL